MKDLVTLRASSATCPQTNQFMLYSEVLVPSLTGLVTSMHFKLITKNGLLATAKFTEVSMELLMMLVPMF